MHLAVCGRTQGIDGGDHDHDLPPGWFHNGGGLCHFHADPLDHLAELFMRSQWFVIHTLSGQEQKVKESIEKRIKTEEMGDYIQEVLLPMEKVAEVRSG